MKATISRRRYGILLSVALVLVMAGLTIDRGAVRAQQAQPAMAKRPVTHQDYDKWRSIQGQAISRDGKFIAYAAMPQDGDGEIIVRNVATGSEWRSPRGWRPPAPPPDASAPAAAAGAFAAMSAMTRPRFTADSRFAVFTIEPSKAEVLKARKEKKKPEEMPKNALGIMDLATGQVTRVERVKSFQVPEDGAGWIAYQLEARPEEKKADGQPAAAPAPVAPPAARGGRGRRKEFGTDLVLRNLATGAEKTFAEALEYSFSKDAKSLVYAVSARKEETNGLFMATPGAEGPATELLSGKGKYLKISWDEEQTQLVFLSDRDDAESKQPLFKLYHWRRAGAGPADKAAAIVSTTTPGFRPGMVLSDRGAISFSQDGARLFFGVSRAPEAEREADADPAAAEEKVLVDLWHWKDDFIQPMQKVRAEADRNRSYRAVWHLKEQKYLQLADATMEGINPASNGLWAIGTDDRAYRVFKGQNTGTSDHYLVNTVDGSRRLLLKEQPFGLSFSPNGKYAVFFDGKDWGSVSIPEGKFTNLTRALGVNFWQEDHDSPSVPASYGLAGWIKDDQAVLLYDQYDIWQVAPDGSSAKMLTDGLGRREKTELRYVRLDPQEKFIDPAKPMLLRAENEWTRDSGFYRDRVNGGMPEKLVMAARNFSPPAKAKDADVMMLTASRFDEFPDIHVVDPNFKSLRKVSDVGAQKNAFVWGRAELVRYKNVDGVPLSGILVKPENFDPAKKYPMIVYIYEKLSEGLHRFTNPSPGTSINASYYASNGYLVFMPDIVYTIGYPGQSALKCVLPAIQAVVDQGIVDEKAIGIQGHSWGGYQIAYMVTQTNRFRAAAPGALVGNMTSAYSGIRWGTGLPRQFQYERTQSRIGGSLWDYPMRFIENSPIFYANRVQTPILMLHNDDDDAVPWYQGIEYYLALRRLEKEVYMFNYNGEKHGLRRRPNQKDYTRRLQEFFDHTLKGAPRPAWMEQGIRYLDREKEKEKYKTASEAGN
ncbi:MAG: prolyl oligopeptidase family serine peptidase [Blastocatellia bacterium]|nr:prolyl oligopeptidase family serine peptidase [Blastocatellia bacterium]